MINSTMFTQETVQVTHSSKAHQTITDTVLKVLTNRRMNNEQKDSVNNAPSHKNIEEK